MAMLATSTVAILRGIPENPITPKRIIIVEIMGIAANKPAKDDRKITLTMKIANNTAIIRLPIWLLIRLLSIVTSMNGMPVTSIENSEDEFSLINFFIYSSNSFFSLFSGERNFEMIIASSRSSETSF